MPRKVITQAAALRIGWDIAPVMVGKAEQYGLDTVEFERTRYGKWTASRFRIENDDFVLDDEMRRHTDGRIRDRYPHSYDLLAFARWFVERFPNREEAAEIRDNLTDPAMVSATIDDAKRRAAFKRMAKGLHALTATQCNEFLAAAAA